MANELQETFMKAATDLDKLLENYSDDLNVKASFPYQIACDGLGTYYIGLCRAGDNGAHFHEDSLKWFRRVLQARSQRKTLYRTRVWHRPPEKLDLYYILCPECRENSEMGKRRSKSFLENFNYCYCMANGINWDDCPEDIFSKSLEPYASFKRRDAWLSGTVISTEVDTEVKNTLLPQGWRY